MNTTIKNSGTCCLFFLMMTIASATLAQGTMLLRQPNASKDHIVFVHADDIWVTTMNGG
ncbi:MAG: hypothetical protein IBJ16_12660, partial [Chitinophagaceae bacterium]|nr:hypothetical protein [Chitinophagaceae bacterium]